jgi:hypothetical protein
VSTLRALSRRSAHGLCALGLLALVSACDSGKDLRFGPAGPAKSGGGIDRLAPGELAPGREAAFGFVAPALMKLERRYPDAAYFAGPAAAESVANYVRKRVEAERVEIGAARTLFPKVRIKGGAPDRVYRFEVVSNGPITKLVVQDITPPPTEPGLSDAERWRRAGFTPDGKPLEQEAQTAPKK